MPATNHTHAILIAGRVQRRLGTDSRGRTLHLTWSGSVDRPGDRRWALAFSVQGLGNVSDDFAFPNPRPRPYRRTRAV